jgi:hypothetical protein
MFVVSPARRRWLATRTPIALAVACAAGLLFATPALAKTAAEIEAESAAPVVGTPCTAAARACVDVNNHRAWLINAGKIARGPVPISTGGRGKDTPTGNVFRVYRKDQQFKSTEFKLKNGQPAPMPFAVFFEDGGIAFHAGSPAAASAGCVHLGYADAVAFFKFLQVGDHVQVMNGPVAAKPLTEEQLDAANAYPAGYDDSKRDRDSDSDGSDATNDPQGDDGDSKDQDKKERDKKARAKKAKEKRDQENERENN